MNLNKSNLYKDSIELLASRIKKKKCQILVTGACGLIGSCLVDVLVKAGYKVYALDLSEQKLKDRFGCESNNLQFICSNICEPLENKYKFDYIVHAASFADPKSYASYPVETILVNILGTKNILEYAKQNKKTRVLFTSTFEVYGKQDDDFCDENDYGLLNFNILRSCYPESKRCSENLLRCYVSEYNIDALIVRLSSVYGPTLLSNDSKAHAQFLFQGLNGENIILKSKGEQIRTYTYVIDAVEALLHVMFFGCSGEVYNIANEESIISIKDLAGKIAKIFNTKVDFNISDQMDGKTYFKPQNCILKNDKIKKLGFTPKYNIDAGLSETIKILKEIYH